MFDYNFYWGVILQVDEKNNNLIIHGTRYLVLDLFIILIEIFLKY